MYRADFTSKSPPSASQARRSLLAEERCASSIRLEMLKAARPLAKELHFTVPGFVLLPPDRFPIGIRGREADALAESMRQEILAVAAKLQGEALFVRPCPVDERQYPHLSFAGVYISAPPRRTTPKEDHLVKGVAELLSGCYTEYADLYYARHQLCSDRQIGVMFMESVHRPILYGVAYVYGDAIITEFYDSILSVGLRDPVVLAMTKDCPKSAEQERIASIMFGLAEALQIPLDVEYLVDRDGRVNIVQIRPISQAHRRNWRQISPQVLQECSLTRPHSAILNSVGPLQAQVIDLRGRKPTLEDFTETSTAVVHVINHRPAKIDSTSTFEFLHFVQQHQITGINLMVDHGVWRVLDHLQYVLVEDPGLSFIIQSTDIAGARALADGEQVSLISDGVKWHKQ